MSWFSGIMFRKHFSYLLQFFHLADNESEVPKGYLNHSKLFKLGGLQDALSDSFGSMYHPNQSLSLDEQMIGTKCSIGLIQYITKKPQKVGAKVWALCESTSGYCIQFQVYTGASHDGAELLHF